MADTDPWSATDELKAIQNAISPFLTTEDLEQCRTAAQSVGALIGAYLSEKEAAAMWKRVYLKSLSFGAKEAILQELTSEAQKMRLY